MITGNQNSRYQYKAPSVNPLLEWLRQPIYSAQTFAAATTSAALQFFRDNISSSSLLDTNMTTTGQLPTPNEFLALGFSLDFAEAATLADVKLMRDNAYLEFKVSQKIKLEIPIREIPSGPGIRGIADGNAAAYTGFSVGTGSPNDMFRIDVKGKGIFLESQQDFFATITYNGAALGADTKIWLKMHGLYGRPA